MADIQVSVDAGSQTRLLTAGKYCDKNILITSSGSGSSTALADSILDNSFSGTYKSETLLEVRSYKMQSFPNLIGFFAPAVKLLQPNAFSYSRALAYVYICGGEIQSNALNTCEGLVALIITEKSVAKLTSATAFTGSAVASATGYIYVPDDLVDQYKAATNWATYASQIKGFSDIPEDVQAWIDENGGMPE